MQDDSEHLQEHEDEHRETRPRSLRRNSMVFSVLAVLVTVGVLPLVVLGWRVANSLSADLSNNQKEVLLDKSGYVAEQIDQFVAGNFARLEVVADAFTHLSETAPGRALDETVARELLERYLRTADVLELRLLSSAEDQSVVRAFSPSFDSQAIAGDLEPHLQVALEKGRRGVRYLSAPFMPRQPAVPQALAVFAVPVLVEGGGDGAPVQRVLAAVVSLASIQERVQRVGGPPEAGNYVAFVLADDLKPFAHTEYSQVMERADLSGNGLVQAFASTPVPSATSQSFEARDATGRAREMIGAYQPVSPEGHRWGVFVQVDRDAGLSQVHAMWATTVESGLLALALAVVIGIVFSLRITGPVRAMTESTRRVASGEYGRRVRVKANNELGMLADNFNLMSENIRKTIDELQQQHEINDQLFLSSIRSLAAAIDARDPYTRGHSERVTRYSRIIARQMRLSPEDVRDIEIGALLHDVGKIGIEDRILRKPSALTPEEFEIMKTHPEKGGDIMEPIATLRTATEIILHHHERWDGAGYPSGLKGDEIPLGARVVSVADTFDAMTTHRPYQRAMTFSVAAKKIGEFSGKACDPKVVVAFLQAFEAGLFGAQTERVRAEA